MNHDKIIIIDFGSQYNHLIARRVREAGVYSELLSNNITIDVIKKDPSIKGIIISGGNNSVDLNNLIDIDIIKSNIPILGIGYGMQLISKLLNGNIKSFDKHEFKDSQLIIEDNELSLLKGIPSEINVLMSCGDYVDIIPNGFKTNASTPSCPNAIISNEQDKIYGVQFHPEVAHSDYDIDIINNFIDITGATKTWNMENFINDKVIEIRNTVKDQKVLLGLSGGVDSSVVAALVNKAIGKQLTCMFINHGLLRKNEFDEVIQAFKKNFDITIIGIDASDRFLNKLSGVTDPERKRKIIGNEFIEVFDEESKKLGKFDFLAQGTIYADIVESGTATSKTIKSHHNVGGLPENIEFKLVEPLKQLFKDEVRVLGKTLGLPDEIVNRQPFPGPGLGIRVIGEVTKKKIKIVQDTDFILRDEIKKANLTKKVWQYFTVLTNIQTVGVTDNNRTYDYTVGIRAVNSVDGMTASWARIPWEVLEVISKRIVNEVEGVNRVVYDITSKPPATIEWE